MLLARHSVLLTASSDYALTHPSIRPTTRTSDRGGNSTETLLQSEGQSGSRLTGQSPISHKKTQHPKGTRPGRHQQYAIKCFSLPLMTLLVVIFNVCLKNYYFPPSWKEAVIIGISKPGKPCDLSLPATNQSASSTVWANST
ncbi:hypothetical protein EVAR_46594_1 [Eumeta japonica]|uniref:Uncharacterized protein n=1 Tax=Eumeta variegata TaxID=151549 RepID=A0A4C1WT82_EUMVA|nr:hypothetical protein EVAR_46594_1 [Eumeta japonica]